MIKNFISKKLENMFFDNSKKGINPEHLKKIKLILTILETAWKLEHISNIPGLKLHPLKGDFKEFWAVTVQANYRIIFKFKNGNVYDVDYIDYH